MQIEKRFKIECAASKDELRPAMQQIRIKNGAAVATDGHVLVSVPIEMDADDTEGMMSPDALIAARKYSPKEDSDAIIKLNGCQETINGVKFPRFTQEEFPFVESVMDGPLSNSHYKIGFNARKLMQIAKSLGTDQLVFTFDASNRKGILVQPDDPDAVEFGILMPFRFGPETITE